MKSNEINVKFWLNSIRNEIKSYSGDLADKNEIIALSKTDTISEDEGDKKIKKLEEV